MISDGYSTGGLINPIDSTLKQVQAHLRRSHLPRYRPGFALAHHAQRLFSISWGERKYSFQMRTMKHKSITGLRIRGQVFHCLNLKEEP